MNIVSAVTAAIVALAVIGAVVALTWHGDITGEAAIGILGTIIGGGGVGAAAHVGVKTGAQAANPQVTNTSNTTAV